MQGDEQMPALVGAFQRKSPLLAFRAYRLVSYAPKKATPRVTRGEERISSSAVKVPSTWPPPSPSCTCWGAVILGPCTTGAVTVSSPLPAAVPVGVGASRLDPNNGPSCMISAPGPDNLGRVPVCGWGPPTSGGR